MEKDLAIYNIVPHKTLTLLPPTFLNSQFFIDYIRGYFDGDGSISYHTDNIKHCSWEIIGASYKEIKWIWEVLANQYGIINNIGVASFYTENNLKMYKIGYYGIENIKKLYATLYYDNCLCLKRKKEKFETILN